MTNRDEKTNDMKNDTRPLDGKPHETTRWKTEPNKTASTRKKRYQKDNDPTDAHVTLPSSLNVILPKVGNGKGRTKNELGDKHLYRPQPIKRTDIIKKGERRETEHNTQKNEKISIKGRPTKRGDGPRWRNRWSATKKTDSSNLKKNITNWRTCAHAYRLRLTHDQRQYDSFKQFDKTKCKPLERTPQLGQNGLTNKTQDNNENDYQQKNFIEPYYSTTTIATIEVASVAHDNWMRICVQDTKRIQDNERIQYTKCKPDTGYILYTDNHNQNRNQNRDKNRDHNRDHDRKDDRNHIRNEKTSHPRSRSQTKARTRAERRRSSYGPCERKTKKYDKPLNHTWLCNFSFA